MDNGLENCGGKFPTKKFSSVVMVIGMVVVIEEEVVIGDGGGVCILRKSETGIEVGFGVDTFEIGV